MSANERQIGGEHYRSPYQHWDFVADIHMDYFLGVGTKHITRWQKKDGIEDLEKTIHYIEKRIEVGAKLPDPEPLYCRTECYWRFIRSNNIATREAHVVYLCTFWQNPGQLLEAVKVVQEILDEELAKPQPEDIYTQISKTTKVPRDSVKKVCVAMSYTPKTDSNKHSTEVSGDKDHGPLI